MFVFTSCTNNYIPKARVLASTLKSFHPDWTFCLLLGEAPPEGFALEEEPFDRLLTFDALGIPQYESWLFRHRVVEICTAAKGPALFHFLAREGHDKVMYLDPDIMVCNSLEPLEKALEEHDVLLTPHQLAPQETQQSIEDNELVAMKYGVFNLGFVAAARRGDGLRFSRWWRDRLMQYCYDDIPNGIFTDQRWCDLAPAFFPNLHIVRDPGCNAASWNLTDRTITRAGDGTFLANGGPLRFYHFTGFDSGAGDGMTARYAANMPAVHELWALYRERLMALGHAVLGKCRWKYMVFPDGAPITDDMRLVYRAREDVRRVFPDPFARPGFLEWYRAEEQNATPLGRARRKALGIWNRFRQFLEHHGGFPQGIPGAGRQIVAWVRKWGVLGVARKVWQSSAGAPVKELMPTVRTLLADPKNEVHAPFFRILEADPEPVLVIEHDWGGGAEAYCNDRVQKILDSGRSVMRLRYNLAAERLEITARRGTEGYRCEAEDIRDLADARFPHIGFVIVNELAGWHHNAFGQAATVPKVLDAVRGLTEVIRRHSPRVEYLFHDYYAVCPSVTLLTPEHEYCGLDDSRNCDACALRGEPFSMAGWREAWGGLLAVADEVVFFSENTRDTVRRVYPLRDDQVKLRPHETKSPGHPLEIPAEGPMRVAVVGNIQAHKGAAVVRDLARILDERMPDASIIVFGDVEPGHIPYNVTVLGAYNRDELASLLQKHNVTVGFFSSIWPETFSFVVHELADIGLPLVCFDLGAQGAYVRTVPNSRVAAAVSAESAYAALAELDAARRGKRAERVA